MTNTIVPPPRLPTPPAQYDQRYFADLVRALQFSIDQQRTPGLLVCDRLLVTNMPIGASGALNHELFRVSQSNNRIRQNLLGGT